MIISYGCVYKRSSKPVMKGSRVVTVKAAREEYKKLLEEGWKKTSIFRSYFWNLAVLMKFAFMSVDLFLLCKSHLLQK